MRAARELRHRRSDGPCMCGRMPRAHEAVVFSVELRRVIGCTSCNPDCLVRELFRKSAIAPRTLVELVTTYGDFCRPGLWRLAGGDWSRLADAVDERRAA